MNEKVHDLKHEVDAELNHDCIQLLSFSIGEQVFAMDISVVKEIKKESRITPVPLDFHALLGLTNFRGAVIPVFNGFELFDLHSQNAINGLSSKDHTLLILDITSQRKRRFVSITVDEVRDIFTIMHNELKPSLEQGSIPAVLGLIERDVGEAMTIVVDSEKLWLK